MKLIGKPKLIKYKKKNRGNMTLVKAIDCLIQDIENAKCKNQNELKKLRRDADCVHPDGFYFFNIESHRTLILVLFDDDEATIEWVGNHNQYEYTFHNNKGTIEKWLKGQGCIE